MHITPNTSCAAVIGHPIAHSLSPILHNRIYDRLGLDMIYMAFEISEEDLGKAVEGLAALGFLGFNVTIPYKERIIDLLDEMDPIAKAIGAVNTVKIEKGKLIGYNTDGLGFLNSIRMHNIECRDRRIAILGAGGSARAIGISLVAQNPKEILILNRNIDRGKHLATDINKFADYTLSSNVSILPKDIDIVINTTPLGMWPQINTNPIEGYVFNPETIVCDIVYNPSITSLIKQATKFGCQTVGGIGMLVSQGVKAIEIWTGELIDDSIVLSASDELIKILMG